MGIKTRDPYYYGQYADVTTLEKDLALLIIPLSAYVFEVAADSILRGADTRALSIHPSHSPMIIAICPSHFPVIGSDRRHDGLTSLMLTFP